VYSFVKVHVLMIFCWISRGRSLECGGCTLERRKVGLIIMLNFFLC